MKTDNELIAEFAGLKVGEDKYSWRPGCYDPLTVEHLDNYRTSWGWIMPACKKWDDIDFTVFNEQQKGEYMALCDKLDTAVSGYEIGPVYTQLMENIKWYNNQSF